MSVDSTRYSSKTPVRRRDGVLKQHSDGATVLLSMASGHYYALDEVGSDIWELIAESTTVEAVARTLAESYDAPLEILLSDVSELLAELAAEQLLESEVPA